MNSQPAKDYRRKWDEQNPEKVREYKRRYREKNKQKVADAYAKWESSNSYKKEESRRRWREANREKYLKSCSDAGRKWRASNPDKVTAKVARRRAQLRNAAVDWADRREMAKFYIEARRLTIETCVPHQVDHIHPLQHDLICGLHNQFNLRVVTAEENKKKHNKFTPYCQGRMFE